MAKKRVLLPADEVDIKAEKYQPELTKGFPTFLCILLAKLCLYNFIRVLI